VYLQCSVVGRIRLEAVFGRLRALAVAISGGPSSLLGRLSGPEPWFAQTTPWTSRGATPRTFSALLNRPARQGPSLAFAPRAARLRLGESAWHALRLKPVAGDGLMSIQRGLSFCEKTLSFRFVHLRSISDDSTILKLASRIRE
jgi:hypothetical protein